MSLLNPSVVANAAALLNEFTHADPFRHLVIDGFFDEALCQRLLKSFPGFEARYALNERGEVGGKAVRVDVREISDAYRALDNQIKTPEFLDFVSHVTGIPDLLYDPDYVGGGTHENVQGQSLDAHVDFNFHPLTGWHRRLNLIVYLNPSWEPSWGGLLELQSNPWDSEHNQIKSVLPLFNRCVIFETNEISWHGFRRITLPADVTDVSRRSFAIYLYTRERPAAETEASHATIYVPDTLPDEIRAGTILSEAQYQELRNRFVHLRTHLKFLYDREKDFSRQQALLEGALNQARSATGFPLQGYVLVKGAQGFWADGWCASHFGLRFAPTRKAKALALDVWVPAALKGVQRLHIDLGGRRSVLTVNPGTRQTIELPFEGKVGETVAFEINSDSAWTPSESGDSEDERPLAFKLVEATLQH